MVSKTSRKEDILAEVQRECNHILGYNFGGYGMVSIQRMEEYIGINDVGSTPKVAFNFCPVCGVIFKDVKKVKDMHEHQMKIEEEFGNLDKYSSVELTRIKPDKDKEYEFTLGLMMGGLQEDPEFHIEYVEKVVAHNLKEAKQKWAEKTGHDKDWNPKTQTVWGWAVVEVK